MIEDDGEMMDAERRRHQYKRISFKTGLMVSTDTLSSSTDRKILQLAHQQRSTNGWRLVLTTRLGNVPMVPSKH